LIWQTPSLLYIHIVFAVKGRVSIVSETNRPRIEKYISGILHQKKQKLYAIYCMPDHIHMLVSIRPDIAVSDIVRVVKSESCKFINEHSMVAGKFSWQHGFGAFSYSESQVDRVVKYILNQPQHHRRKTFKEEYVSFLEHFKISYNEAYLFDWLE